MDDLFPFESWYVVSLVAAPQLCYQIYKIQYSNCSLFQKS